MWGRSHHCDKDVLVSGDRKTQTADPDRKQQYSCADQLNYPEHEWDKEKDTADHSRPVPT
jgi:hypothetical protein